MLPNVRWSVFVVCCVLTLVLVFVVCLLFVVCCVVFAVCCLVAAVSYLLCAVRCVVPVFLFGGGVLFAV